jgi:LPXTG-motif cell wall-anchored protein
VVTNPGGELAATGSSDAPLGWLAGALVLAGAGAVLLARRATRA